MINLLQPMIWLQNGLVKHKIGKHDKTIKIIN